MDVSYRNSAYHKRFAEHHFSLPSLFIFRRAVVIVVILFAVPLFVHAEDKPVTNDQTIQDIEGYRYQIRRLQQGIVDQQSKSEETTRSEKTLLEELEEINSRLTEQQRKVDELEVKSQFQQVLIDIKQEEINSLQTDREKALTHLKKRSAAYYKMGKIGFLNVTFSSKSLPELLKFHDSFQILVSYDKERIADYRNKIHDLKRATEAHALERNLLTEFKEVTSAEKATTDKIRAEKEQLLTRIRTQKHLHLQAAEEMEQAAEDLSKMLLALKQEEQSNEVTFSRKKGKLRVPVNGKVITYFNQEKANNLGVVRQSHGIAIEVKDGEKIRAVAEGTVLFSGYLRGYGNTIIIHHGYQYFTVTSRLANIIPQKGDIVRAGSYLGPASDTASLIDEGIYFEIRHGKQSLDPLKWLDTRKLELAASATTNQD